MNKSPPLYQPLLRVFLAVAFGITADRLIGFSPWFWLAAFIPCILFWGSLFYKQYYFASSCVLLGTLFILGGGWHNVHWNWIAYRDIGTFAELDASPVVLRGKIRGQPQWSAADLEQQRFSRPRGPRSRLVLAVDSIRDQGIFQSATGNVEIFADGKFASFAAGDRIEVAGSLSAIGPPTNPGDFDVQQFFRGRGTLCWLDTNHADSLKLLGRGNRVSRSLGLFRNYLDQLLWQYLAPTNAPLASAMLLGNRDQLAQVTRDDFLLSGTVHLLAISGLHVGILAGLFLVLPRLGLLPRRWGLFLTMLFVIFYAALVEFRPPVTRAAILICVFCYCRWIGRTAFSFNSLALAGLVVLAINPVQLFGVGAQLSFLAVGTLIFFKNWIVIPKSTDPIDQLIESSYSSRERAGKQFLDFTYSAFAVSAVIWLFALPAVAYQFHIVVPIALLANPLLLVPLCFSLVFGMGVLLCGSWFPPLAHTFACGCNTSLWFIQETVQTASQIPGGHWWTSGPPAISVLIFYLVLWVIYLKFHAHKIHWMIFAVTLWFTLGWWGPNWLATQTASRRQNLTITVLDVGHGGCVLLELPGGKNLLYDCGSFGSPKNAHSTASALLWKNGIHQLDAVIISHADSDHFNGLPALAERFAIHQVLVTPRLKKQATLVPMVSQLLQELASLSIDVQQISRGRSLNIVCPATLEILSPPKAGIQGSDNANSIVLAIEFDGFRILLPGDLEANGLDQLLASQACHYDIVMAPHHGSKNSRPKAFLEWCLPDFVIVSAGRGKNTEIPKLLPPDLPAKVFHTGYGGAVQIIIEDQQLSIRAWAEEPW